MTIIAVHNGDFHGDDVFATATLLIYLEKQGIPVTIIRTRDPKEFDKAKYVVDVGGIDNPEGGRFDHHQEGGAGVRENGIPYASFGLVWKKFGTDVSGSKEIADMIEQKLVMPIDAMDNGISLATYNFPGIGFYRIEDMLYAFRPTWKEDPDIDPVFLKAVEIAKQVLEREIKVFEDNLAAQTFVEEAYEKAEDKRMIVLDAHYPWLETILKFPEPLFVIYPKGDVWRAKAIKKNPLTFENRKDFPKEWAGQRDRLPEISGVPDALFCHNMRFTVAAKSKEGILELVKKTLDS